MKERGILMSPQMVLATLNGSKKQTRRTVKPVIGNAAVKHVHRMDSGKYVGIANDLAGKSYGCTEAFSCPYGRKGDLLYVRETWADVNSECGPGFAYRADGSFHQPEYDGKDYGAGPSFNYDKYPGVYSMWYDDLIRGEPDHKWRPSIHMPQWAARIWLEITDVRVERVQDISETDSVREGVGIIAHDHPEMSPRELFQHLFMSIYPNDWVLNSWVWMIEFRRTEQKRGDA